MPIITADERNFRSSYYEKVGCRGVEEKKSLEILLKEKPWDKVKLKQFCYRFTVPAAYRNLIWKVLLGVLPAYTESHEFVMEQRRGQYRDLVHALRVLELAEGEAPLSARLHAMWRLDTGLPTLAPTHTQEAEASECGFVWIAETMQQLFESEVDVYWLSKGLYSVVQTKVEPELPRLLHYTRALLEREDRELYRFLCEQDRWDAVPLSAWYRRCFAKILDDASIAKIWDKVCAGGGGVRVLCCCAVVLLASVRRKLLHAPAAAAAVAAAAAPAPAAVSPRQHVRDTLAQRVEESEELLATKAIELWQCYSDPKK